ncbi:tape measure protein [Mordavella massiliensis]|nr:tape measure protein [Mordavella massiliensis]
MAETFSVKAILSAADKGFTSTMKSASNYVDHMKSTLSSGIGFGVMMAAGQTAFNALVNGASGLVGGMNDASAAWKTFQGNMEMNGKSASEIKAIKDELQAFAEATIYSSSDMASTFAQLEAVGTKNTTKLVKGFGGLAAAAENPTQAMKTLSQQATQMAAKPTVAWEDFKLMLEQTPAGIAAVAKEMGMSTQEMIKGVQAGTIATEDFFDAIAKVGTNESFTKLATEYKTVGQAMDGLTETAANKLQPAFDTLSAVGISAISKLVDKVGELDGEKIASKLTTGLDKIKPYWDTAVGVVSQVGAAFGDAISAISGEMSKLNGSFGSTESVEGFGDALSIAGGALETFAGFLEDHADIIAMLISNLPKLLMAYMAFKAVRAVAPGVTAFGKGIMSLAGNGISGLAQKLFGVSSATKTVGTASATSGKMLLQSAASFMAFGAGIALAATGLYVLAQAAIQIANAGPLAAGVLMGMVVALGALMVVAKSVGPAMTAGAAGFVAFGAAVLIAGAGMYVLSSAAINLASAGPLAIGIMVGMVAAIALLAAGAAVLGPALTAGSVGFIAFGAAIVLVATGALIASAALAVVASVLPVVSQYGMQGAVAIAALGAGMIVFAAGASAAGVASVVLGAGLTVVAVGLALVGAAVLVAAAGVLVLAAGAVALGAGLTLVATSLTVAGAALPLVATGALTSAAGFAALLAAATGLSAVLLLMGASVATLSAAFIVGTAGVAAFGVAMVAGAAGTAAMAVALLAVNSSMKSIASNAKSAQKSLSSMRSSVSVVNDGLDALGNKAKSAIKSLISQFSNAERKAQSSGQAVGNNFNNGVTAGMSRAVSTAVAMSASIVAAMRSAQGGAYSSGVYIGVGLANGIRSQVGAVRSAAASLAAAAEAAIVAKAKIGSPSKVSTKLGGFFGIGWVNGILDKVQEAKAATLELFTVPSLVPVPDIGMTIGGGIRDLDENYNYTRSARYTIIVPVEMEGREVARVTAPYTEAELERRDKFNSRLRGIKK